MPVGADQGASTFIQAQPRRLTARPAESSAWSGNPLVLKQPPEKT
ncbi:hypothetical protein ACQCVP_13615 [Rossellomorea vietnamensis]